MFWTISWYQVCCDWVVTGLFLARDCYSCHDGNIWGFRCTRRVCGLFACVDSGSDVMFYCNSALHEILGYSCVTRRLVCVRVCECVSVCASCCRAKLHTHTEALCSLVSSTNSQTFEQSTLLSIKRRPFPWLYTHPVHFLFCVCKCKRINHVKHAKNMSGGKA